MKASHVQSKREIEAALAAAGLRPDKQFGQHFLIDGNLMRKLADSAEIERSDTVLEVGGGTGGLTDLLVERAGQVVVVEVDKGLAALLALRFADSPKLVLLHGDVLTSKSTIAASVLDVLQPRARTPGRGMLVSNLPYNVATPLLVNLIIGVPLMMRWCFTIQQEVGDRLAAGPGSKEYGPVSILAQTACAIRQIAHVPKSAFWPAPNVESVMLRLDRRPHPFEGGERLARFMELLRASFAHRRKTLRYNLARLLNEAELSRAGSLVDLALRPEAVPVKDWQQLGQALP